MIIYNPNDGGIIFVDDIIKAAAPFKRIISRDKSVAKRDANKELLFIWYCSDFSSPGIKSGFNSEDLIERGKKFCGFGNNYRPDQLVASAINFYRDHNPAEVIYAQNLLEGLNSANSIVGIIKDKMQEDMQYLKSLNRNSEDDVTKRRIVLDSLTSDIGKLLKLAKDIPEAISLAKKAVSTADSIIRSKRTVWGKRELGSREVLTK